MIAIVDYGMGNLRSVQKGLERLGFTAFITDRKEDILEARGVILPGVGAFGDAMKNIGSLGLEQTLREFAGSGRPFLGICLGLHLMFEGSEEHGWHQGLSLLKGKVVRLPAGLKVPHMGWNQIFCLRREPILEGIPEGSYFYFVHSYYVQADNPQVIGAVSEYGVVIPAVISWQNLIGIQFHPEKSSTLGLKILQNFGEMVRHADHTSD
ncbi:MAG: imidazole glycerol phosphate synthase subunit HisH [Syntrophomonadaceae bacterium]|nr:imidazole glycerol phosphate synthase subunit HisH [Syntrophomonadaceae bacterium]